MEKFLPDGRPYATDKVGFGIYHFAQAGVDARGWRDSETFVHDGYDREQCDYQESLDYMNFYIYRLEPNNFDHLRRIKEMGCVSWVYYQPFVAVEIKGYRRYHLKAGWKDEIDRLVEGVKKAGLWDVVVGFQYDEPMLAVETDVFEEFSSYMAKFGKRQLALFSLYELREGTHPKAGDPEFGKEAHVITPSSCRYLTDVGFDWYSHTDYDKFKQATEELYQMMGRDNFYVWQVPCTWTRYGCPEVDEDYIIRSIDVLKKLLFECKYPGGLFCYTWRSWSKKNEGLDYLLDTNNPERWERVQQHMIEVGKEIREIKLNEVDLYSHLKEWEE